MAGVPTFGPNGVLGHDISDLISFERFSCQQTRFFRPVSVPRHTHNHPHFMLVLKGQFQIVAESRRSELTPSGVIFHECGEVHSGAILSPAGHGFTIELKGFGDLHEIGSQCRSQVKNPNISSLLTQLYRETLVDDIGRELAAEGLVLQAVAAFLRETAAAAAQAPRWMSHATQLLNDSPGRMITMKSLSAALNIESKEVSAAFLKFQRCTPAEYQRARRIEIARGLLADTDLPIAQVAAETGFCDQAYFSHRFKRAFKYAPSQYRRIFQTAKTERRFLEP